jgi:hypothetical protein
MVPDELRAPDQQRHAEEDAVDGEHVKPCLRTQKRNHSTTPRATMNETTRPMSEHDPAFGVHDHVGGGGGERGLGNESP